MDVYVQGGTPAPVIRFWADRTSWMQFISVRAVELAAGEV